MNGKQFAATLAGNRKRVGSPVTVAGVKTFAITATKDSAGPGMLQPAGGANVPNADPRIFNVTPADFAKRPQIGAEIVWFGETYLTTRVGIEPYGDAIIAYRLTAYTFGQIFWNLCDLYRPKPLAAIADGSEGEDPEYALAYSNVVCYYEGTPEFDAPTLAGITLEVSIMTSDRWWFRQGQEVGDTWLIVMKTPKHPFYGHAWIAQGNQYMLATAARNGTQMIYSRSAPTTVIPL